MARFVVSMCGSILIGTMGTCRLRDDVQDKHITVGVHIESSRTWATYITVSGSCRLRDDVQDKHITVGVHIESSRILATQQSQNIYIGVYIES